MSKIATTVSELAREVSARDVSISTTNDEAAIQSVIDSIYDIGVDSDQDDSLFEMCDSLVDVYTSDLHKWAYESDHSTYVDDAVNQGLADTADFDMDRAIMAGQYEWYRAIAQEVIEALEEMLDDLDTPTVTAYYTEDGEPVGMDAFEQAVDEYAYGVTIEEAGAGYYTLDGIDREELNDLITSDFEDEQGDAFTINYVPEEE